MVRNFNPPVFFLSETKSLRSAAICWDYQAAKKLLLWKWNAGQVCPGNGASGGLSTLLCGYLRLQWMGGVDAETGDHKSFIQQSALMSPCPPRRGCRGRRGWKNEQCWEGGGNLLGARAGRCSRTCQKERAGGDPGAGLTREIKEL